MFQSLQFNWIRRQSTLSVAINQEMQVEDVFFISVRRKIFFFLHVDSCHSSIMHTNIWLCFYHKKGLISFSSIICSSAGWSRKLNFPVKQTAALTYIFICLHVTVSIYWWSNLIITLQRDLETNSYSGHLIVVKLIFMDFQVHICPTADTQHNEITETKKKILGNFFIPAFTFWKHGKASVHFNAQTQEL